MTIDEALEQLKSENGYYANNGMTDVAEFNTKIIRWLEDYKRIKMLIPIEQALKAEYNKALDDFVNVCEKQFTTMYGQRYVDMRDIKNIAEQLKEGVASGTDNQ